jgi:DNA-binding NtrC family response regulator
MSDDLVSLRLMVVVTNQTDQDLWRRGVAMAAIPVEFSAHDAVGDARATLAKSATDICVIDGDLPACEQALLIEAARVATPAPAIFVSGASGCPRPAGINGMLTKPTNSEEARKVAEICLRAKISTRVLIVDDSGTMRSIVRKILLASWFSLDIQEAAEGFAALEQLRSGNFGMVFLDYNMPGLNGFETLSEIKRECPGVAVVMMTSTLDNAIADRAHAAGALAFLKKPFYPADIDGVLERYFGLHMALV